MSFEWTIFLSHSSWWWLVQHFITIFSSSLQLSQDSSRRLFKSNLLFSDISKNQMHEILIDPLEKVKLTWLVDWSERNVFFHVKNGLIKDYQWFAIGFSMRGDFPNTDFCIFQRTSNGKIRAIVSLSLLSLSIQCGWWGKFFMFPFSALQHPSVLNP